MPFDNILNAGISFCELPWDTQYFGVKSAKAILYTPLTLPEWESLNKRFAEYEFISIENRNAQPVNAQFIGRNTTAFLADVNIQFVKKVEASSLLPEGISIQQAMEKDDSILKLADFDFSKFLEDPKLFKRGGADVYRQWLVNSFEKQNKYFAVSKGDQGDVNGFLLFSYSENTCLIELIAVSKGKKNSGIGTKLFQALEYTAGQHGCNEIKVGTQMRNIGAINFYHKMGCKQTGCHQVYHLWNMHEQLFDNRGGHE